MSEKRRLKRHQWPPPDGGPPVAESGGPPRYYEFGPFVADAASRELLHGGEPLALSRKTFDLLMALLERRGEVVEKDHLLAVLWPDVVVEEANLTQHIYLLRKALGGSAGSQAYVETVPKRGYRFAGGVVVEGRGEAPAPAAAAAGDVVPPHVEAAPPAVRVEPPRPPSRRGAYLPAILTAVLSVVGAAALLYHAAGRGTGRRPARGEIKSLAVLPFTHTGRGGDSERLGPGLTEAVVARLRGLHLSSVRPVTDADPPHVAGLHDPRGLARELGVDAVLEGSLEAAEGSLRLTLRLTRVGDGRELWSGTFNERSDDPLRVQDAVSGRVASALRVHLRGSR